MSSSKQQPRGPFTPDEDRVWTRASQKPGPGQHPGEPVTGMLQRPVLEKPGRGGPGVSRCTVVLSAGSAEPFPEACSWERGCARKAGVGALSPRGSANSQVGGVMHSVSTKNAPRLCTPAWQQPHVASTSFYAREKLGSAVCARELVQGHAAHLLIFFTRKTSKYYFN